MNFFLTLVRHNFSFLSLPLNFVQLLLWCLAMATVAIATFWRKTTLNLLIVYNTGKGVCDMCDEWGVCGVMLLFSVFVFCEYLLSWDGVYPDVVAMVTTATAAVMFWRFVDTFTVHSS